MLLCIIADADHLHCILQITRFVAGVFNSDSFIGGIGVSMQMKTISIETAPGQPKSVRFQFWDTEGQKDFRQVTPDYYRGAHAVVVMYDVTNRSSYQSVKQWIHGVAKHNEQAVCVLVGGKCDLTDSRAVNSAESTSFASNLSLQSFNTSAKDDVNITELFKDVALRVHERQMEHLSRGARRTPTTQGQDSGGPIQRTTRRPCCIC